MILWRVVPTAPSAAARERGGPLWFARELQGDGRHDHPQRYGCLYAGLDSHSAIAETLERYRGRGPLVAAMLERERRRLSLVAIELSDSAQLVDLDEPRVLMREHLRPSSIATADRSVTQREALRLHETHRAVAGLRWWSTIEASWTNVTVFSRAARRLKVLESTALDVDHPAVLRAAQTLRLA